MKPNAVSSKRAVRMLAPCCGAMMFALAARADNPIVQTIYTTDPAPFVHDGRVYVYTGHDEDNLVNDFFTMNEWRVYSSSDMVNWTDHGSPLRYSDFSWSKGDAWAGQVVGRNGQFYFYIPTTSASLGRMAIGVAVSDSPIGPFEDALGRPLITEGCNDIDPTVFIDDDGQAYLYWGNPNLCYVKLNEDMISYEGSVVRVPMTTASFGTRSNTERPTTYEEGPWLYKRGGRYYMVFAAGPISEHIGYSTSSTPTGPWTYGGIVMPTQGSSFTNHAGVIDFMGGSYFFYHNGALPGGGGFHRSVCVESFEYGADGSLPTIDMSEEGVSAVSQLNPFVQTEAETIGWESGVETEPCSEGGVNVTAIDDGDFIEVKGVDFGAGADTFEARVAAAGGGGSIELHLDALSGTQVGTCTVEDTGGAQSWGTTTCSVSGAMGIHDLFLVFRGGTAPLFNLNWWRFYGPGGADAGAAGAPSMDGGTNGDGGPAGSGSAVNETSGAGGVAAGQGGASASQTMGGAGGVNATAVGGSPVSTGGSGMGADDAVVAERASNPPAGCACRSGVPGTGQNTPSALLLALVLLGLRKRQRTIGMNGAVPDLDRCSIRVPSVSQIV